MLNFAAVYLKLDLKVTEEMDICQLLKGGHH